MGEVPPGVAGGSQRKLLSSPVDRNIMATQAIWPKADIGNAFAAALIIDGACRFVIAPSVMEIGHGGERLESDDPHGG